MRIGIVGAGSIVPHFLKAVNKLNEQGCSVEVTGICASGKGTKSYARMEEFRDTYGIGGIYDDMETLLAAGEAEAVYIAAPNHLHYALSRQALLAGVHVLCEKPLCNNLEEAEELFALAKEKGLLFAEAISTIYLPNYRKMKETLSEIGKIRIADFNYSQYSSRYDSFRAGGSHAVFEADKSGGALMDINVYNIHLAAGLFGVPDEVVYSPNIQRGVDTSGALLLRYRERGLTCVLIGSKDCQSSSYQKVLGEEGGFFGACAPNSLESVTKTMRKGTSEEIALQPYAERLYWEIEAFARALAGEDTLASPEHSLLVQKILDDARRSAGIKILQ